MALNPDIIQMFSPKGRKIQQLNLEAAQADLDQRKAKQKYLNEIGDMLSGQVGQPNDSVAQTAGVGGTTQRMPQTGSATALVTGPRPTASPMGQPNGAGPALNPILLKAVLSGVISPQIYKTLTNPEGNKPARPTQLSGPPGALGQTTPVRTGQPSFTLPDPVAFAANARANIWSQTFDKQHSQDMMKINAANTDKISALDLLSKQLQTLNSTTDFKSSVGALAAANVLYQKALKGKLTGLQDTGLSGALDSFFDKSSVDKKSLQQVASAVAKAKLAQEQARDKQIEDLNRSYTDQKVKFFAQPLSTPAETPDINVTAPETTDAD